MKKSLSIILSVAMLFGLITVAFADGIGGVPINPVLSGGDIAIEAEETTDSVMPVGTPPPSVPPSEWAREDVERAKEIGIVERVSFYCYPYAITREKFCEFIYNIHDKILGRTYDVLLEPTFEDTDNTKVLVLYSAGIINGKSETRFAPHDYLTRQEAATIIVRMIDRFTSIEATEMWFEYADMDEISPWASDSVQTISNLGFMKGVGENRFAPKDTYTVEQAVVTLLRVYDTCTDNIGNDDQSIAVTDTIKIDDFYVDEAIQLITEAGKLAADKDFISLYTTNDTMTNKILSLSTIDFNKPADIFYLSAEREQIMANIEAMAEAEGIDIEEMGNAWLEHLWKRLDFSTLAGLINGSYGTENLAALTILTNSRGYTMPKDFKQNFALFVQYEGDYSAIVSFSEYGEGVISANMSFVKNGDKDNVFRRMDEITSAVGEGGITIAKVEQ